ncbi:MAG: hypothetical protein HZC55_07495 [Verrucomicrobia bacterium]|nr:hypothetical protein [Verrucomicrobiota bacterium]
MSVSLAMVCLAAPFQAASLPTWAGDPGQAEVELEQQWKAINQPDRPLPIRGTLRFVLEAAGRGWHPERLETALERVRGMQDLDPASATFGNFKWRSDQPRVMDRNAVEFASQLLGLIHCRWSDRLTGKGRREMEAIMGDAVEGLRRHRVSLDYTNIYLMQAWSLISLGEALRRNDVAAEGYERLRAWLRHTARQGVGEYGAVTYYGIDLDSLVMIARFAGRPAAREEAMLAIRLLWTDIAAHWWAPGDRLGGTNSRSYDYAFGRGYLEAHTWTAGWLRRRPQLEGAGWISGPREHLSVLRETVTFVPPAAWTDPIRAQVPRTVVQRWGPGPEHVATHWVGRRASLASSGASRGSDERTLVADLGDSPAVPQITLFMDGRGDPYGNKPQPTASGHSKALHLTPFLACVQRGPEVLQLLMDEPFAPGSRYRRSELECVLTHLILPAAAELWSGTARVSPGTAAAPTLIPADRPLYVRFGDAVLGLRILVGRSVDGGRAPLQYIAERPEGPLCRLTLVHAERPAEGRALAGVWLRVADGIDDAGFAAWREDFARVLTEAREDGDRLALRVVLPGGPLELVADLASRVRLTLAGGEPPALLSVNGHDLGAEMLAGYRE